MTATLFFVATGELLKFESAVLILVTVGVLILAKLVADLRAEVRSLRAAKPEPRPSAPAPAPVVAVPAPVPAPPASDEIPADVFAAIVAAVSVTLGQAHHIVSVTPSESLMWSREGRRNIFSSHTFR